jgi:hypothetical protein
MAPLSKIIYVHFQNTCHKYNDLVVFCPFYILTINLMLEVKSMVVTLILCNIYRGIVTQKHVFFSFVLQLEKINLWQRLIDKSVENRLQILVFFSALRQFKIMKPTSQPGEKTNKVYRTTLPLKVVWT